MNCPACKDKDLRPVLTKKGVEVDRCEHCGGIYMDKGEIFHFTNRRQELANALRIAIQHARPTSRKCPKSGEQMQEIPLLNGDLLIDYCPANGSMWFDRSEVQKLLRTDPKKLAFKFEEAVISLYALLTLVLILGVEFARLPASWALGIGVAIAAVQFLLGPWLMDLSLNWFYKMRWVPITELPEQLHNFVRRVCSEKSMKIPRLGIIDDGAPNAFTYGHTPNNARVVITRGLFDLLDDPEVEAVVAHEIGHAKNWDMFLMTVVQLVPLILYYVYRSLMSLSRGSGSDRKGSGHVALAAIATYLLYVVCEYIVLWFSRIREYHADRFAGQVTNSPNSLASALVKIAYGLAGRTAKKTKEEDTRSTRLDAVGAMGIFDSGMARSFAVSAYARGGSSEQVQDISHHGNILGAMKWDLWNPWANYFELHSTHPLVARRMNHLGNQAQAMGQAPFVQFSLRKPESYWDEFLVDILIMFLPLLSLLLLLPVAYVTQITWLYGLAVAATGFLMLVKIGFSYPTDVFPDMSVSSLLKKVKVSGVRGIPCKLNGKIVGKGVPGLIWSEDFVIQDETGIIFLDYRQPLRIWEFLFGLMRSEELQDAEVEIKGWYRRSPVPYIELKTLKTEGKSRECYVYTIKTLSGYLFLFAGLAAAVFLFIS
jgi:heat shock protein HtpX